SSATLRHLHSFPTRRSSDLPGYDVMISKIDNQDWNRRSCNPDDHSFHVKRRFDKAIGSPDQLHDRNLIFSDSDSDGNCVAYQEKDRKSTRLNSSHVSISYAV